MDDDLMGDHCELVDCELLDALDDAPPQHDIEVPQPMPFSKPNSRKRPRVRNASATEVLTVVTSMLNAVPEHAHVKKLQWCKDCTEFVLVLGMAKSEEKEG